MIRAITLATAMTLSTSAFAADCWTGGANQVLWVGETELIAGDRVCDIGSIETEGNWTVFRAGCVSDELGGETFIKVTQTADSAIVEWDGERAARFRRCDP